MSIVDIPRVTLTPASLKSVYNTLITYQFQDKSPITYINNVLVNIKFGTVNSKTINTDVNNIQYNLMVNCLVDWLNVSTSIPEALGNPAIVKKNFRILVVGADGLVYYDSAAGSRNTLANIKTWDKTNGKYYINENHGTRSYIQGAGISADGSFYQEKNSTSTGLYDIYYAQRQGLSNNRPIGFVVVIANVEQY